jgi:divalent metal cation (Fe/Co/Zn/Cd) transporter
LGSLGPILVSVHSMADPNAGMLTHERHSALIVRGRRLEYLTITWNIVEAGVALVAGVMAGSVALVGFGFDSVIETASASVLLWRLRAGLSPEEQERVERMAHRLVGVCFLALAVYVSVESVRALWLRSGAERSLAGIILACLSVVVMPLLARAKRNVAAELRSGALHADSRQTDFCAYLSAILLLGLLLNWLLGWWWADAVAALVMAPIILREGVQGIRGEACGDCGPAHDARTTETQRH